jgi:hypothetical protein
MSLAVAIGLLPGRFARASLQLFQGFSGPVASQRDDWPPPQYKLYRHTRGSRMSQAQPEGPSWPDTADTHRSPRQAPHNAWPPLPSQRLCILFVMLRATLPEVTSHAALPPTMQPTCVGPGPPAHLVPTVHRACEYWTSTITEAHTSPRPARPPLFHCGACPCRRGMRLTLLSVQIVSPDLHEC